MLVSRLFFVSLLLVMLKTCRMDEFIQAMSGLVADNGYPLETHTVTTSDGYLLDMHRIPYGLQSPAAPGKPVVLLMHAMYSSSYSFVFLGKDHSLAFILADAGYDVWMGNSRGNVYARKNIYVSSNSSPFWQFSWHERGVIDLPAMLDYVLDTTGQEKLFYVSLSRGSTMFFVMASEMPEYNDKIRLAVALAPAVFMSDPHNQVEVILTQAGHFSEWVALFLGINEFYISPAIADMLNIRQCMNNTLTETLCSAMFFMTGGSDLRNVNPIRLSDITKASAKGTSVKEMVHFGQLMSSKKFTKYNYGFIENVNRYNSIIPPAYNLSRVTAPVVIFSSKNDRAIVRSDVEKLIAELPNLIEDVYIEEPKFSHVDFVMSDDARTVVYEKLLENLKKY